MTNEETLGTVRPVSTQQDQKGRAIAVHEYVDRALEIRALLRDSPWTRTELHWEMIKPERAGYPHSYETFTAMLNDLRAMCIAFERFPRLHPALKAVLTNETPMRPNGRYRM